MKYAYLGPAGTFTEAALLQVPGALDSERIPASSVNSALAMVREGSADAAMVPIENSVEGGVSATLDAIAAGESLQIVAEVLVPISFVLAVRANIGALEQIREISTHGHAWAQCRLWAEANIPAAVFTPAASTAAGALGLLDPEQHHDAAICSPLVAEARGLKVLVRGVEDNAGAVTRFILVTSPGAIPAPTGVDKSTLILPLSEDRPGALMGILEQFTARGVNLSRIESRPTGAGLGRYFFSVDVEGHIAEERVSAALAGLHRLCPELRFLGSYPAAQGTRPFIDTHNSDGAFSDARDWVLKLKARL
ncbi:prephenate dehydratase [Arthrobacter sp. MYb211]|uniref:prephenate dehydratase n=1 Tax=unclassified Arthrobacter TaxID=235627 RepID=UPI000CFE0DC5|nr:MULTISPECIES: prephenate dehydratase [unclassified Arthrobacter]PQZ97733.1 prephenate dehydratase [Arthrobacter sp. MYb224]PRA04035.1 prephenate dehydratase [Arthrobacter sp. MYb229]PRA10167.1 prephenate dehydratase [Arthrobacter sp. MYb221]PRB52053.1 prephenate dehydratase [Arthrobacter sp. MYb216]PRC05400.1 prephenate dehydratase [Arthrobacter sp. MYb211]